MQHAYTGTMTTTCMISNRITIIERLLEDMIVERKAAMLRHALADYRRHHSMDATDPEYYGLILLDAIVSWVTSQAIIIDHPFSIDDPLMMIVLKRSTKNDNLALRMIAFYYAYLSSHQLEEFEVWNEPLDHTCI